MTYTYYRTANPISALLKLIYAFLFLLSTLTIIGIQAEAAPSKSPEAKKNSKPSAQDKGDGET